MTSYPVAAAQQLVAQMHARAERKRRQGKEPGACDIKNCRQPAAFKIMFRLWPKHHIKGLGNCATGDMSLIVCSDCAPSVKREEFFHDRAWAQIVRAFASAGKAEPDRASAEIFLERLQ